jgi:hypothetical protein
MDLDEAAEQCCDALISEVAKTTSTEEEMVQVMIRAIMVSMVALLKSSPNAAEKINATFATCDVPWRLVISN